MKIAYNSSIFFLQKYGGISRYFCSIINEFIKDKKNIKVYSPIFKNNYLLDLPQDIRKGFYLPRYPLNYLLKSLIEKISYFQINNSNCDIVHDTYYSKNILKYKYKKKIITVYDLIHEKFSHLYKNKNLELKKKVIQSSDAIICISENTKKDLIEYYRIDEKKIFVTYLGYDHIIKNYSSLRIDQLDIPTNFILFVGSRYKYKNFRLLLETYCSNKDIKNDYQIVCFGGEKFSKEELKNFNDLNIKNRISYFSGDDTLLSYLYKNAKLFVFPSQYEGFGIPLLEAMAIGCPVLASDISIFREICKNGINYFKNNDKNDLSDKLKYLLYSDTNSKLKINLALSISKEYSWKKCSQKTYDIYRNL